MPKEYYSDILCELKIIGNCIRIVTDGFRYCHYNIRKEYLIGIIRDIEGTAFIFKDMSIIVKTCTGFSEQLSAIQSELEGSVQTSTDLLGINT